MNTKIDYAAMSNAELFKAEREIAEKYRGRFPLLMVIWAFGNLVAWLALWALVLSDTVSLWIGFPIAVLNMALVYLPTHDAQHDIIARKGTKLRWLNELVGHGTTWMLGVPYNALRYTHLQHHLHANDPDLDPDFSAKASGPWHSIWNSLHHRQPNGARTHAYGDCLQRLGRTDLIVQSVLYKLGFVGILCSLAWSGFALEAFFLWWLPIQIALIYIDFYLSWAPHHPGDQTGRYRDTRAFRSRVGNILSAGMQYHIIHHLHPFIPLNDTPAAYRELRPILEARGCNTGGL
ncbi:MAG: beta-carotene hydroxylase [Alphaproteobacteria bacterium]|nr:MAG: beta-carotene hydroxylase [Alphaproteobacteria bacterium]